MANPVPANPLNRFLPTVRPGLALAWAATAALLAGCGSWPAPVGPGGVVAPAAAGQRGGLVAGFPKRTATLSAAELQARLAGPEKNQNPMFQGIMKMPTGQSLLDLTQRTLRCGVDIWSFQYHTVGGAGEPTTSSAALMTPTGGAGCTGSRPVVSYARSASMQRYIDLANLDQNYLGEPELLAALFAAQGYIVVASNYAGYDQSTLGYHPYFNADQQSGEMIDALAAAKTALARGNGPSTAGDQLLVAGYSQGGHVAMATHRAMQQLGMRVVASAASAGPFAMALFGDHLFQGRDATPGNTLQLPLLFTGYQRAYGDLYRSSAEYYLEPFADGIEGLLPSAADPSALIRSGKLPQRAVFSLTPPTAADPTGQKTFDAMTPPVTGRPAVDAMNRQAFGDPALVRNQLRADVLADIAAHPDGASVSPVGVGLPNPNARHPLRRAFVRNDLRGWTPASPVFMCSFRSNPWVPYASNQHQMAALWSGLPFGRVTTLDLEADASITDSLFTSAAKQAMTQSKEKVMTDAVAKGATDGGRMALATSAHHWLGQPLCMAATLVFFEDVLNTPVRGSGTHTSSPGR